MPNVTLQNVSSSAVYISDLYKTLAPGASVTFYRSSAEITSMKGMLGLIEDGKLSEEYTYTAAETGSNLVPVPGGVPEVDGSTALQVVNQNSIRTDFGEAGSAGTVTEGSNWAVVFSQTGEADGAGADNVGLLSGRSHTVLQNYSVISGGLGNQVLQAPEQTATSSTVGGGEDNISWTDHSTIGGGHSNRIGEFNGETSELTAAPHATIGGGQENSVLVGHGTIGGGLANSVSGQYGTVGGGGGNAMSGYCGVIGGGANNTIEESVDGGTIVGGRGNRLVSGLGHDCTAMGTGALGDVPGAIVHAAGANNTTGDAQSYDWMARGQTPGSGAGENVSLRGGGGSGFRFPIASSSSYSWQVIAIATDSTGNARSFNVSGIAGSHSGAYVTAGEPIIQDGGDPGSVETGWVFSVSLGNDEDGIGIEISFNTGDQTSACFVAARLLATKVLFSGVP